MKLTMSQEKKCNFNSSVHGSHLCRFVSKRVKICQQNGKINMYL